MKHRNWAMWVSVLLGLAVIPVGCSALRTAAPAPTMPVPQSNGILVSGEFTAQQGTLRWQEEFDLHTDGRVTQVLSVEGTDRFADLWRERYQQLITSSSSEFTYTAEERENQFTIKAIKIYPSVEVVNESGAAQLKLLDGPLFRSVVFKSETGAYDADSMVDTYGIHEEATAEDWVAFLQEAIMVGYVVKDEASGQSYRWDKTAGEIGSGLPVVIQWKQWRSSAYLGGGVIGAFLLFVIYMGLLGRRHWAPAEE